MASKEKNRPLRGVMKHQEPMSKHTSWRVGGPVDTYYIPADVDDLCMFISTLDVGEPLTWIGLGSNLLVRDGGIRGTAVAVTGALDELKLTEQGTIKAGAGVTSSRLARFSANAGYTGAEFLAGIPGSIGGALVMNAGAFGGETWDIVLRVETINDQGELLVRDRSEFEIAYRKASLAADEWFVSAEFVLQLDQDGKASERIREFLRRRSETQPTGESSCGSVFRNPPGDHAARLIDACGLKEKCIGNACVSAKHANFIINCGGASAFDIEQLIFHVQEEVEKKFDIKLQPEVRIIGDN